MNVLLPNEYSNGERKIFKDKMYACKHFIYIFMLFILNWNYN